MNTKMGNLTDIAEKLTREVCLTTVVESPFVSYTYDQENLPEETRKEMVAYVFATPIVMELDGNKELADLLTKQAPLDVEGEVELIENVYFLAGACVTYHALKKTFWDELPIVTQEYIEAYFEDVCGKATQGKPLSKQEGEWERYTVANDPLGQQLLINAHWLPINEQRFLMPAYYIIKDHSDPRKRAAYDGNMLVIRLIQTAMGEVTDNE